MKPIITPNEIQRIHDSTTGGLRRYELEKKRCLDRTNRMFGEAIAPHEKDLQQYADLLRSVVESTHHVASCRVSSSWVTLQFPPLSAPNTSWRPGGEISIHLPKCRDDIHPFNNRGKWKRTFPFITIRPPGALDKARCYQLRPNETPAQAWDRARRFMDAHALESTARKAA